MLDMLVFDVDLKRVPVLIVLAAIGTSYCLFCTRVYILHVSNKVLCRDIFITSLTVDLTCNLIKTSFMIKNDKHCVSLANVSDRMSRF